MCFSLNCNSVWSRVVNVRGGSGHNIPLDLHMEHLNRVLKDYVVNLGANKGEKTIIQCGKSLAGIMGLCQEFDVENNLAPQSVEHTKAKHVLKELVSSFHVFDYVPGRFHKSFKGIQPNIANSIDMENLLKWLHDKQVINCFFYNT